MSRIRDIFEKNRGKGTGVLITYITGGYPGIKKTKELILIMEDEGSDIVEVGIPFSDPIADGPVIQRASQRALSRGVHPGKILSMISELRQRSSIPIVLMGYYNNFLKYGEELFARDAKQCGVDGIIVPDLPPEEAEVLRGYLLRNDMDMIFLVAPTSSEERIRLVCSVTGGFLYCVSLTGVTGQRESLSRMSFSIVKRIREISSIPVAMGFGISKPDHARELSPIVDGIVVGSAIVGIIEENLGKKDMLAKVGRFVREMKMALINNK